MVPAVHADDGSDQLILNNIHHVNQKEIKVSKLALSKTKSPQVKQFAQMLKDDHSKNDEQLQALAKSDRIKLKDFSPTPEDKAKMDKMKKMSGTEFDKAFLAAMKKGHEKALNMLESSKAETQNPEIAAFIDKTIPTVRHHEETVVSMIQASNRQAAGKANAGKSQGNR